MGLEAALFGAPLLSASTASTVGLLGSAGVFAPLSGSLLSGSLLSTLGTALSLGSAASSITGGMQARGEAKRQANLALGTAAAQATEQARVSALQAGAERREAESHRRAQKLAYLKSGVSLEGSPLLMMEATRLQGQRNVNEIIAAGGSAAASSLLEGRTMASNYRSSGRQAFMSGLTNAGVSLAGAF